MRPLNLQTPNISRRGPQLRISSTTARTGMVSAASSREIIKIAQEAVANSHNSLLSCHHPLNLIQPWHSLAKRTANWRHEPASCAIPISVVPDPGRGLELGTAQSAHPNAMSGRSQLRPE